jgi:hypothetical protein
LGNKEAIYEENEMINQLYTVLFVGLCFTFVFSNVAFAEEAMKSFPVADWVDQAIQTNFAVDVTIDYKGQVIFAQSQENWGILKQYDHNGEFLGNVYFDAFDHYASSIAADTKGFLWVATHSDPVKRYKLRDMEGASNVEAGSRGTGQEQYEDVRAIAVDKEGRLYAADSAKGKILQYTVDGGYLRSWRGNGNYVLSRGAGVLSGLTVDDRNNIYVVDQPKRRVVVFDSQGTGVRTIGEGTLAAPFGVAVGRRGHCFVSDQNSRGVFIFDPAGRGIAFLDGKGSGPNALKAPCGLALDERGDLWIADAQRNISYRFATGRLLYSLEKEKTKKETPGIKKSFTVTLFASPGAPEQQSLFIPAGYLKERLLGEGLSKTEIEGLNWEATTISVNEESLPCQMIDIRGDGPGTDDDFLAVRLRQVLPSGTKAVIRVTGDAPSLGVPSPKVTARYEKDGDELVLQNDKYVWRISGGKGFITSITRPEGKEKILQGDMNDLRISADAKKGVIQYKPRVICSGPLVAGVELVHVGDDGCPLVRRFWLWREEPFIREWLEAFSAGTLYIVHQMENVGFAGKTGQEVLSPDRRLELTFNASPWSLVTAFDETSLEADGYKLQRMASVKLPNKTKASYAQIDKQGSGVEQTLCLRGPGIRQLRWAVGVTPQAGGTAAEVWNRVNSPIGIDKPPVTVRSDFKEMAGDKRFSAATRPPAPLCDFYNMESAFPDLSGLLGSDIDKKGFLHPKGTHFVFDDGSPLNKFWAGCTEWTSYGSLCVYGYKDWPPVGKKGVDQIVDWIAINGFDFMRWHHHDHVSISWIADQQKSTIKPEALDIFHYLLACLHQKGVRMSFDSLLIQRPFEQFLPNLPVCWGTWNPDNPENMVPLFNERAIQLQKDFATNLLTSQNPYRKCRVIDDPTLAMVSIENERRWTAEAGRGINNWNKLKEPYLSELTGLWNKFLLEKYKSRDRLNKTWATHPLQSQEDPTKGTVPLPPVWDIAPNQRKRPNPRISDGRELVYWLHRRYLKTMYGHLRSIGFKGIIYSNGDQVDLEMRRAAAEVLDATATAQYSSRMGMGFPLSPAGIPVSGKPVINREWGPQNDLPNAWWSILPHVITADYCDQPYPMLFMATCHDSGIDQLLPNETSNSYAFSGLAQNFHPYSALAAMAGGLVHRFVEIERPKLRVELGVPYDGNFFDEGAGHGNAHNELADTTYTDFLPQRKGKQKEVGDIPPLAYFTYWPVSTRFFKDKLESDAGLVTNLPLLPAGDFSGARKVILTQPVCTFDRYGNKTISAQSYFERQGMKIGTLNDKASVGLIADWVDTDNERKVLYRSFEMMGMKPPVTLEEFGKVWRDSEKTCTLDMANNQFYIDRPNIQAMAGLLSDLDPKVSGIDVTAAGIGAVWWVPWSNNGLERSMVIAALDGECRLNKPGHVGFISLIGRNLEVFHQGRLLASIQAPQEVNITVKAVAQDDVAECPNLYLTPMRPISNRLPIKVTVSAPAKSRVFGCRADGTAILEVAVQYDTAKDRLSFITPNREDISFYLLRREK